MRDPDSGQLWLQYWLWYIYNDYHLAFNAGLHEGDWEMVQVGMDGDEPKVAVYAQHDQAERRLVRRRCHPAAGSGQISAEGRPVSLVVPRDQDRLRGHRGPRVFRNGEARTRTGDNRLRRLL